MDLHWFMNSGDLKQAARDIVRFVFYAARMAFGPPLRGHKPASILIVTDVVGVGGVLTLLPLLNAMPPDTAVCLAVTALVDREPAFKKFAMDRPKLRIVNIENVRVAIKLNFHFISAVLALSRHALRLLPTLPLFFLRHHIYSATARSLICETKTRAVVLFNERMLPSACYSAVARSRGVKVIAVQHGNFVDNYLPVLVDRYLTWGDFHSEWLRRRSSCEVKAIGAPRMDAMTFIQPVLAGLRGQGTARIVFFSQVGSASVSPTMIDFVRAQVLSLLSDKSLDIVIKLHPNEKRDDWLNIHASAQDAQFLDRRVTVEEAIQQADVVCSFYSTVLVEALLWAVPVLQLNPFQSEVSGFPDATGIAVVRDAEALRQHVSRLRSSPDSLKQLLAHQRLLSEGYFREPGKACPRFWNELVSTDAAVL